MIKFKFLNTLPRATILGNKLNFNTKVFAPLSNYRNQQNSFKILLIKFKIKIKLVY